MSKRRGILPSVAIAAYAVKTTTVSELISGMERIHMPKEVTIQMCIRDRREADDRMESAAIVAEDKGAYQADREGRTR